jgi:Phage ABA sandwich domain
MDATVERANAYANADEAALREIDAEVALQVMGWRDVEPGCYTPSGKALCGTAPDPEMSPWNNGRAYVPRYSILIGAAWQVVEKIGLPFHLERLVCGHCCARFAGIYEGIGHGPAEAICHAALKAVRP